MKKIFVVILLLATFLATNADAATLTTEIARVRELLYQTDSANSIYSDALITEAINEGQDLISDLLSYGANYENCLIASAAFTTGAVTISTPTNFKLILELYDTASPYRPYIQIKPEEAHRLYTATTKDPMFLINGGTIKFYPAATAPGTLEVSYLKAYPRLSSGSDTLGVQDRFLNILTLSAVWYVLMQDNQTTRAATVYKQLSDLIAAKNASSFNGNIPQRVSGGSK